VGRHGGGNHQYEVTEDDFVGFKQVGLFSSRFLVCSSLAGVVCRYYRLRSYGMVHQIDVASHLYPDICPPQKDSYFHPCSHCSHVVLFSSCHDHQDQSLHSHCRSMEPIFESNLHRPEPSIPHRYCNECIYRSDRIDLADTIVRVLDPGCWLFSRFLLTLIPRVWHLQVPLKSKLRVFILLGAGGIATGASIVRLFLVFPSNSFDDETISFVRFNLLGYVISNVMPSYTNAEESVAEVGVGIICACLPSFGIFFARYSTDYASQRARYKRNSNHCRVKDRKSFQSNESSDGSNSMQLVTWSWG
jgi:hypothetical protein